jgi:hypothetical protein
LAKASRIARRVASDTAENIRSSAAGVYSTIWLNIIMALGDDCQLSADVGADILVRPAEPSSAATSYERFRFALLAARTRRPGLRGLITRCLLRLDGRVARHHTTTPWLASLGLAAYTSSGNLLENRHDTPLSDYNH